MPGFSGLAGQWLKNLPGLKNMAVSATISLAASATTDGMQFTVKFYNHRGQQIVGVIAFELWISEAATGVGLTADSYSGTVTAVSTYGAIHTAATAKKHLLCVTNASGEFRGLAVDSANPTDQYVAVKIPATGRVFVSGPSLTNWEGA